MSKFEHDEIVARYRQQKSSYDKPWFNSCSDALRKNSLKGLRCLDLCCGNCEYSEVLRDTFSMDVTCGDYIPFHLEQAEKLGFPSISINLDDSVGTVREIAEQYAGKFDLIVNLAAIEHVYNSDNLIQFAHTLLKPSGLLVINTPNIGFLGYRMYSVLSGNRPFGEGHHVRFWDYRFLRTNLFLNGFRVKDDCRSFHSLPEDILTRGLRNHKIWAKLFSTGFLACRFLQHVPLLRGLMSDELTVVCQKEDVEPVGFDYLNLKKTLEKGGQDTSCRNTLQRLQEARQKGWLKEHLNMSRLLDENIALLTDSPGIESEG